MSDQFITTRELAEAVAPLATKQDLADVIRQNKQDLTATEDRLTETIREAQTELLRAFHNWARPVELRLNRIEEVAQRMSWAEERIAALEQGKFPSSH